MLPRTASGTSTAMFALRVRKPEKILISITGVLPAAIKTIMVSPTARPNPTINAEKMPLIAVGMVIRHALGRTVTATDNIWFTLLTNNTNPIHFDRHYAAGTEFAIDLPIKPLEVQETQIQLAERVGP